MFGPTQSNRAGLRPAGAIDLLPAAMGWARRVQPPSPPQISTMHSLPQIFTACGKILAARFPKHGGADPFGRDGLQRLRTVRRPVLMSSLDACAPHCLQSSGRASSRAGSCGEQHGAQVSAQLPAHPDTTSHMFPSSALASQRGTSQRGTSNLHSCLHAACLHRWCCLEF